MKYIIIILILISIVGCKNNPLDSKSDVIYEKSGRVDSIGFVNHNMGGLLNYSELDLTGYSKLRITFSYKAKADTAYYTIKKYGTADYLWISEQYFLNTNGEYRTYDSTFTIPAFGSTRFERELFLQCDSCYYVSKDLMIQGLN